MTWEALKARRASDEEMHEVTLTRGFYLGKYEVTNAQYEAVMTSNTKGIKASLQFAKVLFPSRVFKMGSLTIFYRDIE